jgi:hypothetical protein
MLCEICPLKVDQFFCSKVTFFYFCLSKKTEGVAQLVRATACGAVGRGFETHHSPWKPCKFIYKVFLLKG